MEGRSLPVSSSDTAGLTTLNPTHRTHALTLTILDPRLHSSHSHPLNIQHQQGRSVWGVQEDGRRQPALWAATTEGRFRVGCLQGIEGLGITGPSDTLGIPWLPRAIRPRTTPSQLSPRSHLHNKYDLI
jgi:hypothetical protein